MIDWGRLTLILYILMRMSGFVLFSPIFGRRNFPGIFQTGLILVLTWTVSSIQPGAAPVPATLVEFSVRLLLELAAGYLVGLTTQLFFYLIPQQAGEILDNQMALTMSKDYDPASQASMSVTGTLLTILTMLLFFTNNGHSTLLRILLSSGSVIPFGEAALGKDAAAGIAQLFIECMVLAVKLAFPVLAAELLGQIGMGILMKVIPQINVFSLNIELKLIIGLGLLALFMAPMSEYLLDAEERMLAAVGQMLALAG